MSMIATIKNKFLAGCASVTEFSKSQRGVTAVEYAVVIAGVTAVVLVIFGGNGPVEVMLKQIFSTIGAKVTTAVDGITTP